VAEAISIGMSVAAGGIAQGEGVTAGNLASVAVAGGAVRAGAVLTGPAPHPVVISTMMVDTVTRSLDRWIIPPSFSIAS